MPTKITAMTEITTLDDPDDVLYLVDQSANADKKVKLSTLDVYVPTAGSADAALTPMAVGNHYYVDISAYTADRIYALPTTAAVGDRIKITLTAGDDDYRLLVRTTAASTDTINGTVRDTDEGPWALFITGESLELMCTTANSDWTVINDGRIPCHTHMHRNAVNQTGIADATLDLIEWTTIPENTGNIGSTGDDEVTVRRAGTYLIVGRAGLSRPDGNTNAYIRIHDGAASSTALARTWTRTSGNTSHWTQVIATLTADDGGKFSLHVYMDNAGDDEVSGLTDATFFTVTEIL